MFCLQQGDAIYRNEIWQVGKNKGLKVIGIDLDEPIDKVKEFAKRTKVTYPLALDPEGAIFYQYAQNPQVLPEMLLLIVKEKSSH